MDNINLKAAILAVILFIVTYIYYVRQPGSVMSFGVAVVLTIIAGVMVLAYFFAIKLTAHLLATKVYPNTFLYISIPFLVLTTVAWIIYALFYVKAFGVNADFWNSLINFLTKHGLFIAICTIAIGLTYSFPTLNTNAQNPAMLRGNLTFSALVFGSFIATTLLFYFTNKINQPNLATEFKSYKTLQELNETPAHRIENLATANPYNHMLEPYFLPNKNEVILVASYGSYNKLKPLETIYRIDKNGLIIEKFTLSDIELEQYLQLTLKDGFIVDHRGKRPLSWIFDGNKSEPKADEFVKPSTWQIDTLKQNHTALKMLQFQKTNKLDCNGNPKAKYNGNNYYLLNIDNEEIKFKIDSIYSHRDNIDNCVPKKIAFYTHPKLNFSLLCFDEIQYFIVKKK